MPDLFSPPAPPRSPAEDRFRKLFPQVAPIKRFLPSIVDVSPSILPHSTREAGSDELLSVALPCPLFRAIISQWDLYCFVVPEGHREPRFAVRMPTISEYLRAQARRICPATGGVAWDEKQPQAVLQIEMTAAGLYALLFFCCSQHGLAIDRVRDAIEPVLWAWERRHALEAPRSDVTVKNHERPA